MDKLVRYIELVAQVQPERAWTLLEQINPCPTAKDDLALAQWCLAAARLPDPVTPGHTEVKGYALERLMRAADRNSAVKQMYTEQATKSAVAGAVAVSHHMRLLVAVLLRGDADLASWAAVRSTWTCLDCSFVALATPAIARTLTPSEWLRVVEGESMENWLGVLYDDKALSKYDSVLVLTAQSLLLGNRLPSLMAKSTAGGEQSKVLAVAHVVKHTTTGKTKIIAPYFFNRSTLTKIIPRFRQVLASRSDEKDQEVLLGLSQTAWTDWSAGGFGCAEAGTVRTAERDRIARSAADAASFILFATGSFTMDAVVVKQWQDEFRKALETVRAEQWAAGKSITFVTGLFDIRSRERASGVEAKSAADYVELARPLLEWDCNLYVVTEARFADAIRKARHELGYGDEKTKIVTVQLQDTCYYDCIDTMFRHYATGRVPERFYPPKDTPLYVWCMWQKYDCIRRALADRECSFVVNCQSLYWIDLGIYHVAVSPPPQAQAQPLAQPLAQPQTHPQKPRGGVATLLAQLAAGRRLRCTLLRQLLPTEVVDRERFFSRLQQAVGGGLIGGPRDQVRWLCDAFDREARASLKFYPVLDEAILGAIVMTHPERFMEIYSGHREMLLPRDATTTLQTIHRAAFPPPPAQMAAMGLMGMSRSRKESIARALDLVAELEPLVLSDAQRTVLAKLLAVLTPTPAKSPTIVCSSVERVSTATLGVSRATLGVNTATLGVIRVGMCDGGEWFRGTVLASLKKHVGANCVRVEWVGVDPAPERLNGPGDLLLFSQHFSGVQHKRYHGCRKLCVTGEINWPGSPQPYECDLMITTVRALETPLSGDSKQSRLVFVPFAVTSFWERRWHSLRDLINKPKTMPTAASKPYCCAFFYHNCVPEREAFFDRLSKIMPGTVHALGRSRASKQIHADAFVDRFRDVPGSTLYDSTTVRYLPYRFVVAFESHSVPGIGGYITEKLPNPMLAGAIPIYRGAPDVGEFFNERSFINGNGKSDEQVVAEIAELEADEAKRARMWAEPWIHPDQLQKWFLDTNPHLDALIVSLIDSSRSR